jgi:DNA-binding HxlR family transcriptional regulator
MTLPEHTHNTHLQPQTHETKVRIIQKLTLLISRTCDPRDTTTQSLAESLGMSAALVQSHLRAPEAQGIVQKTIWNPRSAENEIESCWRLTKEGRLRAVAIAKKYMGISQGDFKVSSEHLSLLRFFSDTTKRSAIRLPVHLIETHRSIDDPFFLHYPELGDLLEAGILKNDTCKGYLFFYLADSLLATQIISQFTRTKEDGN